jgi:hypothetical protein
MGMTGDNQVALVTEIEASSKQTLTTHKPTRCTYSVLLAPGGKRVFRLDTYGSADREFPEKVSQCLQFTAESAAQLIDLFMHEFPSLQDRWRRTEI